MVDFNTAVQTALTPAVTIPVIAALAIIIVAQAYFDARRMKARLRAQAERLGKATAMLLAMEESVHKRAAKRLVGEAIEAAYDALKDIGFDKLARGDVTFEGVMFGDSLPQAELRRRQSRERDPAPFSMDELKEALGGMPRYSNKTTGGDPFAGEGNGGIKESGGASPHEDALNRERKNDQKGRRPYHVATPDLEGAGFGGRSPRAG
jgi:ubiquitin